MGGEHGFTERQILNLAGLSVPPAGARLMAEMKRTREKPPVAPRPKKSPIRRAPISDTRFLALLERDGWRCGICFGIIYWSKRRGLPASPTADHIWPVSKWTEDQRSWVNSNGNIRVAHNKCNSDRGSKWDDARDYAALRRNGLPPHLMPKIDDRKGGKK